MLTHRGFSAWIVAGEQTLEEHLVAVDEKANRVSCWITGEEGKTFAVYWRDHGGNVDTCSFITLDGFVVPGRFLFGSGVAWRQGIRSGHTTERPFMFSRVKEIENNSLVEAFSKDHGMIVLRIKRIERTMSRAANAIETIPGPNVGNRRPGDLCIGFGEETPTYTQFPSTWAVKAYNKDRPNTGKPSTYVSFVFRYRSREFLRAQGILNCNEVPVVSRVRHNFASAPITPVASTPVTPSRTPSPLKNKESVRPGGARVTSNELQWLYPWMLALQRSSSGGVIQFDPPRYEEIKEEDEDAPCGEKDDIFHDPYDP